MSDTGPVFILGMPRSGTKLLMNILNRHQNICISNETEFLTYYLSKYGEYKFDNYEEFYGLIEGLKRTSFFYRRREEGYDINPETAFNKCDDYTVAGVFKFLAIDSMGCSSTSNPLIWGDKSPSYTKYISLLENHFDKARYIHIVRDVRDCAISSNKAWNKNMFRYAQRWNDALMKLNIEKRQLLKGRIHEIRYEDLCLKPEETIKECCNFLETDFSRNMLDVYQVENFGDAKGKRGVYRNNTQKYKDVLSQKLNDDLISLSLGPLLIYGYEIEEHPSRIKYKRMGTGLMFFYQLKDFTYRMIFELKNEGWMNFIGAFKRQYYHFVKSRPRG